jgi:thermostable 8-oxoguanine DNA glycosylase
VVLFTLHNSRAEKRSVQTSRTVSPLVDDVAVLKKHVEQSVQSLCDIQDEVNKTSRKYVALQQQLDNVMNNSR